MEPQQKNQDQKQAQSRKGMPGLIEDTITSTV
ncbi:MAG TPA: phage holin family protein, partial [Chlorobaculum parvum]|nr:phage holin family protein [Chlorobaculum parvum]